MYEPMNAYTAESCQQINTYYKRVQDTFSVNTLIVVAIYGKVLD